MTDISYQLYSSRDIELDETLNMLGRLGYTQVEGYGGLFRELTDAGELRAKLDRAGLRMTSAHVGLDLIEGDFMRVIDIARALGIDAIFVPSLGPDDRPDDAESWMTFGRRLALAGRPLQNEGLTFGWHNHDFEFARIDGAEKPLDLILNGSETLALELDLAWVQKAGEDPMAWLRKYGERIVAAHVKDIAPEGENAEEDGWADPGHGIMDWPALMAALRETGCRYLVMEHDKPADHARFASRAIETVRNL